MVFYDVSGICCCGWQVMCLDCMSCHGWYVVSWVVCHVLGDMSCLGWYVMSWLYVISWVVCHVLGGMSCLGWYVMSWVVYHVWMGRSFVRVVGKARKSAAD